MATAGWARPAAKTVRDVRIAPTARHWLQAVYPLRFAAAGGGLMSVGPDIVEEFRQAVG
jgi:hypothetical protein